MDSFNYTQSLFETSMSKRKLNRPDKESQMINSCFEEITFKEDYANISNKLISIGITGCTWETYRVNALYNFSEKKPELLKYQKMLALNAKKALQESDSDGSLTVEITVTIEKFPDVAVTEKDGTALKFTIKLQEISEGATEKYSEMFTAFLLSIKRKEGSKDIERLSEGAVVLPLLLIQYDSNIFLESFVDFLEENFSCFVSPLKFSPTDLKWMIILFSCHGYENEMHSVTLGYKTPFEELKSIEYILDTESISSLWNKMDKSKSNQTIENKMDEFFSDLENNFYEKFRIQLSRLQLCEIKMPVGQVLGGKCAHSIEVSGSSKLSLFLSHLTHLAQWMVC